VESSLVGTINSAWALLFGGTPPTSDGLLTMVERLEAALHGTAPEPSAVERPPPAI